MRQIGGTKSEIPFLDFQNGKKFDQCKVGTLVKVIEAFKMKLTIPKKIIGIPAGLIRRNNKGECHGILYMGRNE